MASVLNWTFFVLVALACCCFHSLNSVMAFIVPKQHRQPLSSHSTADVIVIMSNPAPAYHESNNRIGFKFNKPAVKDPFLVIPEKNKDEKMNVKMEGDSHFNGISIVNTVADVRNCYEIRLKLYSKLKLLTLAIDERRKIGGLEYHFQRMTYVKKLEHLVDAWCADYKSSSSTSSLLSSKLSFQSSSTPVLSSQSLSSSLSPSPSSSSSSSSPSSSSTSLSPSPKYISSLENSSVQPISTKTKDFLALTFQYKSSKLQSISPQQQTNNLTPSLRPVLAQLDTLTSLRQSQSIPNQTSNIKQNHHQRRKTRRDIESRKLSDKGVNIKSPTDYTIAQSNHITSIRRLLPYMTSTAYIDSQPKLPIHNLRQSDSRKNKYKSFMKSVTQENYIFGDVKTGDNDNKDERYESINDNGVSQLHNTIHKRSVQTHMTPLGTFDSNNGFINNGTSGSQNVTPRKTLYIGGLFELTGNRYGRNGRSELLATQMAITHVNQQNVIPGYRLELLHNDSQCDPGVGTDAFYDLVYRKSKESCLMMMIGGTCNEVTKTLAEIVPYWNLVLISYAADSPALSEREKYRTFFRMALGHSALDPPRRMLVQHFKWKKVAVLYEELEALSLAFNTIRKDFALHDITVTSAASFKNAALESPAKLKELKEQDVRIIVAGFSEAVARLVLCEAYKLGLIGARYVWILVDGLRRQWWNGQQSHDTSCTMEELSEAVNGMFTVFGLDRILYGERSLGNLTYADFLREYNRVNDSLPVTMYSVISYDTVWTMALAIRNTLQRWEQNGTALLLHQMNYTQMSEITHGFIDSVESLSFSGVSGPVSFAGSDREGISVVYQVQDGNCTPVAIHKPFSSHLDFDCDLCKPVIWSGKKVPKDEQTVVLRMKVILPSVFYTSLGFCLCGILMAVFFLCYNLYYRKLKFIKLSSPNLNNVAVIGCILVYGDVILLGLDDTILTDHTYSIICTTRAFLLSCGFSLAFGAMFAKTFRVHRIFTRVNRGLVKSRLIRDSHLLVIIGVLLIMDIALVCTWVVVDPLHRQVYNTTRQVSEDDLDLVYQDQLTTCYSDHLQRWLGAFYGYKGLLLVFGVYMAWETRQVKIPALNDSQYIGLNVYNVVIMAVCVVVISNIVSTRPNLTYAMVASFMILSTTITLCLLFVPKICAIVASKGNPIVASSGILVDRSNTRRFVFDDRKEVLYRAEVQNRVYKREIMELDKKITRLDRLLDIPIHPIPRLTEELLYLLPSTLGERTPQFRRGRRKALEWCNSISDGGEGVTWNATESDEIGTDNSLPVALSLLKPTKIKDNQGRKSASSQELQVHNTDSSLSHKDVQLHNTNSGYDNRKNLSIRGAVVKTEKEGDRKYTKSVRDRNKNNRNASHGKCGGLFDNGNPRHGVYISREQHNLLQVNIQNANYVNETGDEDSNLLHKSMDTLQVPLGNVPFYMTVDQTRSLPDVSVGTDNYRSNNDDNLINNTWDDSCKQITAGSQFPQLSKPDDWHLLTRGNSNTNCVCVNDETESTQNDPMVCYSSSHLHSNVNDSGDPGGGGDDFRNNNDPSYSNVLLSLSWPSLDCRRCIAMSDFLKQRNVSPPQRLPEFEHPLGISNLPKILVDDIDNDRNNNDEIEVEPCSKEEHASTPSENHRTSLLREKLFSALNNCSHACKLESPFPHLCKHTLHCHLKHKHGGYTPLNQECEDCSKINLTTSADNLTNKQPHSFRHFVKHKIFHHDHPHNDHHHHLNDNDNCGHKYNLSHLLGCLHPSNRNRLHLHRASCPTVPGLSTPTPGVEFRSLSEDLGSPTSLSTLITWQSCSAIESSNQHNNNCNVPLCISTNPSLPSPSAAFTESIDKPRELIQENYPRTNNISRVAYRTHTSPFSNPLYRPSESSSASSISSSSSLSSPIHEEFLTFSNNKSDHEHNLNTTGTAQTHTPTQSPNPANYQLQTSTHKPPTTSSSSPSSCASSSSRTALLSPSNSILLNSPSNSILLNSMDFDSPSSSDNKSKRDSKIWRMPLTLPKIKSKSKTHHQQRIKSTSEELLDCKDKGNLLQWLSPRTRVRKGTTDRHSRMNKVKSGLSNVQDKVSDL